MKLTRRTAAIVLVGTLVVGACGSGDEDALPSAADAAALVPPPPLDPDGPDATIAPDLPDEYRDVVGPVEVIGDPLAQLESNDFSADPAVGTAAPVLVGLDYDGRTVRVDAGAAGPTMVVFLAHWCPHCNAEIPVINQLRDDDRIPADVNVVAVSTAVRPGQPNFPPDTWLDDKEWTYPVLADGIDMVNGSFIAASAYGVGGFPFITLIDANGNVTARWSGEREPNEIAGLLGQLSIAG